MSLPIDILVKNTGPVEIVAGCWAAYDTTVPWNPSNDYFNVRDRDSISFGNAGIALTAIPINGFGKIRIAGVVLAAMNSSAFTELDGSIGGQAVGFFEANSSFIGVNSPLVMILCQPINSDACPLVGSYRYAKIFIQPNPISALI